MPSAFHENGAGRCAGRFAGKEQSVLTGRGDSGEQGKLGRPQVLRFVDDDMVEGLFLSSGTVRGDHATDLRTGEEVFLAEGRAATAARTPTRAVRADEGRAASAGLSWHVA